MQDLEGPGHAAAPPDLLRSSRQPFGGRLRERQLVVHRRVRAARWSLLALGVLFGSFLSATPSVADESPANDDFLSAAPLSGLTGTWSGTTANATAEPGEPAHGGVGAGRSVWLTWTAPETGKVTFTAQPGPGQAVVAAAYTGKTVDTLTEIDSAVRSDDGGHPVRFRVVANQSYHLALDAAPGSTPLTGPVSVDFVLFAPQGDAFGDARQLEGRSDSASTTTFAASRQAGEPVHASSVPTGGSVWFTWTATRTGTAAIFAAGQHTSPAVALYTGASVDALNSIPGSGCGPETCFAVVGGSTYHLALAPSTVDAAGAPLEDDIVVRLRLVAPSNDDLSTASDLPGDAGQRRVVLRGSAEAGEPAHAGAPADASRWYRWTPEADGIADITLTGAGRLAVYLPGDGGVDDLLPLSQSASHEDAPAELSFPVTAARSLLVAVDAPAGVADPAPAVTLRYALGAPANDRTADAQRVHVPGTATGTNLGATAKGGPIVPGGDGRSVWYRLAPRKATPLMAQTAGSSFETALAIYEQTRSGLRLVASDAAAAGQPSLVRFRPRPRRIYFAGVDGRGDSRGDVVFTVARADVAVITVSDIVLTEGEPARFQIGVSPAPRGRAWLDFTTRSGVRAKAPMDYTSHAGRIVIAGGQTSRGVSVTTVDDALDEPRETFRLRLKSSSPKLWLAHPAAVAVLTDNDLAPELTLGAGEENEPDGPIEVDASLSRRSGRPGHGEPVDGSGRDSAAQLARDPGRRLRACRRHPGLARRLDRRSPVRGLARRRARRTNRTCARCRRASAERAKRTHESLRSHPGR